MTVNRYVMSVTMLIWQDSVLASVLGPQPKGSDFDPQCSQCLLKMFFFKLHRVNFSPTECHTVCLYSQVIFGLQFVNAISANSSHRHRLITFCIPTMPFHRLAITIMVIHSAITIHPAAPSHRNSAVFASLMPLYCRGRVGVQAVVR